MYSYKRPSLMTAHKVEKITALRRAEEQRISELSRYSNESRWLSNCAEKESLVDQAREANLIARNAAEAERRKLLAEKQENRQREIAKKGMERRVAEEIHRQKTEKDKRERELQRICETSEELKTLERQLKTAYINKERAAQHQEALLIRKLENDREQAIEEKMEHDRQNEIRREEEKEHERRQNLIAQKAILQKQMLEKKENQETVKKDALRDKKLIDDIIEKINREDEMEHEQRMKKIKETRDAVAELQEERRKHLEELERERQHQEAEIKAYNDMLTQRALKEVEEKERFEAEKKRRWEKVVEGTKSQTDSKEEFDMLRAMLWEEELEVERKKEEDNAAKKRLQLKEDLMRENNAQILAKKAMLEQMEKEEKELVDIMLKKFADDEEDEKRKEENRRAFRERFKADAIEQRLERLKLVQKEKEMEEKEINASRQQDEYKQRVIQEAKRRLLQNHSDQLRGFLPSQGSDKIC